MSAGWSNQCSSSVWSWGTGGGMNLKEAQGERGSGIEIDIPQWRPLKKLYFSWACHASLQNLEPNVILDFNVSLFFIFLITCSFSSTKPPALMKRIKSKEQRQSWQWCTCRKDHVLGDEFIVDDGELWQFYSVDPGHCAVSTSPVKLNIICGVAICGGETRAQTLRDTLSSSTTGLWYITVERRKVHVNTF